MGPATAKSSKKFDPVLHERYVLGGEEYIVQPHPQLPHTRYAATGAKGTVYKLKQKRDQQVYGLKVFRAKYRNAGLLNAFEQLRVVQNYEGMMAARRIIIQPGDPLAQEYADLQFAMLMPWVHGQTWFDLLLAGASQQRLYRPEKGVDLCKRFLTVMEGLENSGFAHTDIAPGNVMFETVQIDTQLLDLEDLYGPSASRPARENTGQDGYRHQSADRGKTLWCAEGDRYASAVMAAEILIMSEPSLARGASDTGYFAGNCKSPESQKRYERASDYLRSLAPDFAEVFKDSWWQDSLERCPKIAELRAAASTAKVTQTISDATDAWFSGSEIRPRAARPGRRTPPRVPYSPPASAPSPPPSAGQGFGWGIPEGQAPSLKRPAAPASKPNSRAWAIIAVALFLLFLVWAAAENGW
jgi:hypothetical protein